MDGVASASSRDATPSAASANASTAQNDDTARRRSGRVVRKPGNLLDEISAAAGTAKRKRVGRENGDGDVDMGEDVEAEDDSEVGSEGSEERGKRRKRVKKMPRRKPTAAPTASASAPANGQAGVRLAIRPAMKKKTAGKRKAPAKVRISVESGDVDGLYGEKAQY